MHRNLAISFTLAALVALTFVSLSVAGKFNKVVSVGDKAPAWTALVGIDDERHSLADYQDAKAVVVIFTCNHCPVAVAYEDRIIEFTEDYKDKGVQVVAINVNNIPADRLHKMKERAEEKGFNFPYLYDPTQQNAREYGATVTPHVFLLDGDRRIAYMGAIDDNNRTRAVKEQYLRPAVDAVLAGSKPEVKETLQRGCTIKYEN